jgi:hypothetical protein
MMFKNVLKSAGLLANLVILATFFILATALTMRGLSSLQTAGGLPSISTIGLLFSHPIEMLNLFMAGVVSGNVIYASAHYILAWVLIIIGLGFWWLTALGVRWLYHAILRASI